MSNTAAGQLTRAEDVYGPCQLSALHHGTCAGFPLWICQPFPTWDLINMPYNLGQDGPQGPSEDLPNAMKPSIRMASLGSETSINFMCQRNVI